MPKHDRLVSLGERGESILPELVAFFEQIRERAGEGIPLTYRFLRRFSGAQLTVPHPAAVEQLLREIQAADDLVRDQSPAVRLLTCKTAGIDYARLERIYLTMTGKKLERMDRGSRAKAIDEACVFLKSNAKDRRLCRVIADMYGLSASEFKTAKARLGAA